MNLHIAARAALAEADVEAKLAATDRLRADWQAGLLAPGPQDEAQPLTEAGRPKRPELLPQKAMPRRDLNGPAGHAALIHALCHIEFTAINLALDAVYRFPGLPDTFYADWLKVAAEEVLHFRLLREHLRTLGRDYGDLPAHGGLWETALLTAHDPLARMAVIPRYFEARGLDVTPGIQAKLRGYGDPAGAGILDIVLRDEIGHVAAGDRWFRYLCGQRGLEPVAEWHRQIDAAGLPAPRGPFNEAARAQAGFPIGEISAHGPG
ncbi:MAG: ferritin-like domain-containing protein [Gallionellaceae bacterium]|nr:ferritin-like domain-containing protein [Gallionellaceae bacterium]